MQEMPLYGFSGASIQTFTHAGPDMAKPWVQCTSVCTHGTQRPFGVLQLSAGQITIKGGGLEVRTVVVQWDNSHK